MITVCQIAVGEPSVHTMSFKCLTFVPPQSCITPSISILPSGVTWMLTTPGYPVRLFKQINRMLYPCLCGAQPEDEEEELEEDELEEDEDEETEEVFGLPQ